MNGDVGRGWPVARYQDFSGGENLSVLPEKLAPNQLYAAQNCLITADGLLETRKGKTKVNLDLLGDLEFTSVHRFAKENGDQFILVQQGMDLYAKQWDGVSQIDDLSTDAITCSVASSRLRSVIWKDNIFFVNGEDTPFRFDGEAFYILSDSPPAAKYIAVYASKLWLANYTGGANNIVFCALEDYDSWNPADLIYLRSGDSDEITGLAPLTGGMIITKNRSVWPLYGFDKYDITIPGPLSDVYGCTAPDTLVSIGDRAFFVGKDSMYSVTMSAVSPFALTHQPMIKAMTDAHMAAASAVFIPAESRLMVALSSAVMLNIDLRFGCITTWTGLDSTVISVADKNGDCGALLCADRSTGQLFMLTNVSNDDGTDIRTTIMVAYADMGTHRKKVFRRISPEIEPISYDATYPIQMSYDTDFGKISETFSHASLNALIYGSTDWLAANWGLQEVQEDSFWLHGVRGKRMSFTMMAVNRIRFHGYTVRFREAGAS